MNNIKLREIKCKAAIGKCGFPGGGLCVNPYVGCSHGCVYCYARFMKRFTGHNESWGTFVDARVNIDQVLAKQLKSKKYQDQLIYLGTVTDPYQSIEGKYKLTRKVLKVLLNYQNPVSILTKSDIVCADLDLLKQFKNIDVGFTITTLNEKWKKLTEPYSPTIKNRLKAIKKLTNEGISVSAMIGPYWPYFTDAEALFKEFTKVGVTHVFSESLNTTGGNWTGVEKVLKNYYPHLLKKFKKIFFDKKSFFKFYTQVETKVRNLSKKYQIPITIFFGLGHAAKFK